MTNANTIKKRVLILASASKRRQKILRELNFKFKILTSNVNEESLINNFKSFTPKQLVKILAFSKALSVCLEQSKKLKKDEIIAGFDTIVVCKNKIISKPKNKYDALKKLLFISNKKHNVLTGICLIDLKKEKIITDYESTDVYMKKIENTEALAYIRTKEPMDKAGAYAIQGKGERFVKRISGSYSNVVGLPINKFLLMLGSLQ